MMKMRKQTIFVDRTMKAVLFCGFSLALLAPARGADAQAGNRLAQTTCAACHIVGPNQRQEIAEAPPFAVIARQFATNPDGLVMNLIGPHARMNFGLGQSDAENVAAYIATLAK
jgi:mono/diheme cytochrome c family protein